MIKVVVYKSLDDFVGFKMQGHAGYAEEGYDIICAAVSALTINCLNSIEEFTDDEMDYQVDEDGFVELHLGTPVSKEANLLLKSTILGISAIQNNYGNEYIEINFKEV